MRALRASGAEGVAGRTDMDETQVATQRRQTVVIRTSRTDDTHKLRRFVIARDQGCCSDGCDGTYRLQALSAGGGTST